MSQEVTLDEYAAGQSMKEHYDNSQKEYLEYCLNAKKKKKKLFFHYSADFFLSVLLMANLCSFLQNFSSLSWIQKDCVRGIMKNKTVKKVQHKGQQNSIK